MIDSLDEQAKPTSTIQVHKVSGRVSAEALRAALAETLAEPEATKQKPAEQKRPEGQDVNRQTRGTGEAK